MSAAGGGMLLQSGSNAASWTTLPGMLRHIVVHEGFSGLARGVVPSILRDAPYSGLYIYFYTELKKVTSKFSLYNLREERNSENDNNNDTQQYQKTFDRVMSNAAASSLASALATIVTQPPDVIRTRLQLTTKTFLQEEQIRSGNHLQNQSITLIRSIIQEEGFGSLFRGVTPRLMKRCASAVITWCLYEEIVRIAAAHRTTNESHVT